MIIRVKKPHIIIIANHANFSFQIRAIRAIRAIRVLLKNSQIRDKKSVPGWLFCEAFFSYQSTQTQHMPSLSRNGKPTFSKVVLTQKDTVMA